MITTVFLSIIGLTIIERIVELRVGQRNLAWSLERGGVESGQGHWPWMVTLHTVFLGAMEAEALFTPTLASFPMTVASVIVAVAAQGLRWWCIRTLGPRWNPAWSWSPIFRASRPALIGSSTTPTTSLSLQKASPCR